MKTEERDRLAAILEKSPCPLCDTPLILNKDKWGWGANGCGVKCIRCGLQLRAAWMPLLRAIRKLGK